MEWVVEVGDEVLAMWEDLEFEEEYAELMVFTACRLWPLFEEGVHASKTAAAEWALRRDPSFAAVAATLQRRSSGDGPQPDEAAVMALLHMVREAIQRARGDASRDAWRAALPRLHRLAADRPVTGPRKVPSADSSG